MQELNSFRKRLSTSCRIFLFLSNGSSRSLFPRRWTQFKLTPDILQFRHKTVRLTYPSKLTTKLTENKIFCFKLGFRPKLTRSKTFHQNTGGTQDWNILVERRASCWSLTLYAFHYLPPVPFPIPTYCLITTIDFICFHNIFIHSCNHQYYVVLVTSKKLTNWLVFVNDRMWLCNVAYTV